MKTCCWVRPVVHPAQYSVSGSVKGRCSLGISRKPGHIWHSILQHPQLLSWGSYREDLCLVLSVSVYGPVVHNSSNPFEPAGTVSSLLWWQVLETYYLLNKEVLFSVSS